MTFAIVFPGQGSQKVGMLDELSASYPSIRDTFAEASDVLGTDLWDVVSNGPAERLDQTEITQPAMLAADISIWRILEARLKETPAAAAGHSLGEYAALVAAGRLTLAEALSLVEQRAHLMVQACSDGAMAAVIGLSDSDVVEICSAVAESEAVAAANFNSPGQVVVSGTQAAVARVAELARDKGAKRVVTLAVSVPSHSPLMTAAVEPFRERLAVVDIRPGRFPVLHNVDAAARDDGEGIKVALEQQLNQPVRWVQTIQALASNSVDCIIECGPGAVLSNLGKRTAKTLAHLRCDTPAALEQCLEKINDE